MERYKKKVQKVSSPVFRPEFGIPVRLREWDSEVLWEQNEPLSSAPYSPFPSEQPFTVARSVPGISEQWS